MKKHRQMNVAFLLMAAILGVSTFTVVNHPSEAPIKASAWSGVQTSNEGSYFSSVGNETGEALKLKLRSIISSGTSESYNWERYEAADEAEGQPTKVLLIYSRQVVAKSAHVSGSTGWNREHSFAKSLFNDAAPAVNDNHHIFADDNKTNGQRGNKPFNELNPSSATRSIDSYGNVTDNYYTSSYFMPNDLAKGEVARSTMYMNTRYGYSVTLNFYSVELMLKWHLENPVTNREIYRNNTVHSLQKNRNPYIDRQDWACKVYGDTNASTRQLCNATQVDPTSVTVTPSSAAVNLGSSLTLNAAVLPSGANQAVSWSSSNPNIATVSNGVVTSVAVGQATITARSSVNNTLFANATITVTNDPIGVTGVTLNKKSINLALDGSSQLSATISPSNATNKNLIWSSNQPTIASVSSTGLVRGLAVGQAQITVKTVDGNFEDTAVVTISEQVEQTTIVGSFYNTESSTGTGAGGVTVDNLNKGISSINALGFGGVDVINTLTVTQGYFPRSNGLSLGSSSSAGKLVLTLNEMYYASRVSVLFNDAGVTGTTVSISGDTEVKNTIQGTIGTNGSNPSTGTPYVLEFHTPASQITINTSKRTALVSIVIDYGKADPVSSLTEATNWADAFLNRTTEGCLASSKALLTDVWGNLATNFSALSNDARQIISNTAPNASGTSLEEAVARYIVIIEKYELLEFIPGVNVTQPTRGVFTINDPNKLFTIIGGLTLFGLVATFFVLDRKLRKN